MLQLILLIGYLLVIGSVISTVIGLATSLALNLFVLGMLLVGGAMVVKAWMRPPKDPFHDTYDDWDHR